MSPFVQVAIHESQFPEQVRHDLLESLRTRQVNHKFHYDSIKQTQKWLALHQAYSPSRTDADCAATYDRSFCGAVARIQSPRVRLVGLGCGGGQKDARLLRLLKESGKQVSYVPVDISTAMVLVAQQAVRDIIPDHACYPIVCDLAAMQDVGQAFQPASADDSPIAGAERPVSSTRLVTFFGMMPNFEPHTVLPRLADLLRPQDFLLLSANLSPGPDYDGGINRILPLYDNALTRDWLLTFLFDLGVEAKDGHLQFIVEEVPLGSGLKRIAAYFHFTGSRTTQVDAEEFKFDPGDSIRLFFSYRHTPTLIRSLLAQHRLRVLDQWIAQSGEEGVFLVGKSE